MVERAKIATLVGIIRDNVADLERYAAAYGPDDLRRSRDAQHQTLHALFLATQASIDCANHLLADAGLPQAQSYRQIFDRLREGGILPAELAARMADWASMRNVLAHLYPVLDLDRVHAAISSDLDDLRAFADVADSLR